MQKLYIEVIRTVDANDVYYRGNITVRQLMQQYRVATWTKQTLARSIGHEMLYDRGLDNKRADGLARYFLRGGTLSLDLILNCRNWDEVEVTPLGESSSSFVLGIPAGVLLYIVDGQHRFAGKQRANQIDDQLPVRICNYDLVREALEFFFINHEGQRVSPDLHYLIAHQIYYTEFGRKYRESNPDIVANMERMAGLANIFLAARNLGCDGENPIDQILRFPNCEDEHNTNYRSISISSMAKLTRKLRNSDSHSVLRDDEWPGVILNILASIRQTWPVAWEHSLKRWQSSIPHPNLVIDKSLTPIFDCVIDVLRHVPKPEFRNIACGREPMLHILDEVADTLDTDGIATTAGLAHLVTPKHDNFWVSTNKGLANLKQSKPLVDFVAHLEAGRRPELIRELITIGRGE